MAGGGLSHIQGGSPSVFNPVLDHMTYDAANDRIVVDIPTDVVINPRVVTTTDDATAVIDVGVTDVYELTAIANATTFTLTGTPVDGQTLLIRFKDAGVSKALTWTGFTELWVALPAATTAGKWHYVGVKYNLGNTSWNVLAVKEEA